MAVTTNCAVTPTTWWIPLCENTVLIMRMIEVSLILWTNLGNPLPITGLLSMPVGKISGGETGCLPCTKQSLGETTPRAYALTHASLQASLANVVVRCNFTTLIRSLRVGLRSPTRTG